MAAKHLRAVSLRRVLPSASFVACGDIAAQAVTDHHTECRPGHLYAVVRGARRDGREFVPAAIAAGAEAVLVDQPLLGVDLPQCVVPGVREAYSRLCLALAGHPERLLQPVGVTGTNGKTTVTWLLRSILQAAGHGVGLTGTVEYSTGRSATPAELTTPGPAVFADLLRRMARDGATRAVMEFSSHALDQSRLGGLPLSAAVLTNITQDHFDYHGNFDAYLNAKAKIAEYCAPGTPIIANADDPGSASLIDRWSDGRVVRFGLNPGADARAMLLETATGQQQRVRFEIRDEQFDCELRLPGRHNVSNCLAAATTAMYLGVEANAVVEGLSRVAYVPGRMQPVELGQPFSVYVDYAHTPDALAHAVSALRPTTTGRLICVFGAGGDRDREKRPLLGAAASAADVVVVTSDNPRSEEPASIIGQVCDGVEASSCHVEVERGAAIDWAIRHALPGDCVLIAGKGHERSQQIGPTRLPFDDCAVAAMSIGQHHAALPTDSPRPGVTSWTP